MRLVLSALVCLPMLIGVAGSPAAAAPIWIERQAIPSPVLVDARFAVHDATSRIRVDHGAWAAFLSARVTTSADGLHRVDYGAATPADRAAIKAYLALLQAIDPQTLTRDEALAFWINLYNAATVDAVLDAYPVASIRKISGVWTTQRLTVLGTALSLGDLEHKVVRAAFPDPRAHYALNCASYGCPNLALVPFTGEELEGALDAAAHAYVNHPRGVRIERGRLVLSKIYGWYRDDFGGDAGILEHLTRYSDPQLAQALAGDPSVKGYQYDWSLNDVAATPAAP